MTILEVMQKVVIASKHDVAETQTQWKEGTSRINNTYKALMDQVQLGNLVKGSGYFKIPGCESEFKEHSQLLTKALISILKVNPETEIYREKNIPEVALRPDALILLRRDGKARCLILEVCNNETDEFLQSKINFWLNHPAANRIISEILQFKIPHFDIVVSGKEAPKGTSSFKQFLQEVQNEIH